MSEFPDPYDLAQLAREVLHVKAEAGFHWAAGEIGRLRAKLDESAQLWTAQLARAERAEADAAVLRDALHVALMWAATGRYLPDDEREKLEQAYAFNPGAALLAELEAARKVVDQARRGFGTEADIERAYAFDPVALCAAIRRYDEAVKVREP